MRKRKLHHIWVKLKPISYWYFLIACLLFFTISIFALRSNNLTAIKLRNTLNQVDKENGNVSAALNNLRSYIYSHMNTNLASPNGIYPPIQLQYTYQRLLDAEQSQANATNTQIYTQAENYCQAIIPNGFSGRYRIPCIENYVTTHGVKIQSIPTGLYEFDFVSPFWSPDLAGWSIVLTALFFLLFIARFTLELWLKHNLNQHS